MSDTNGTSGNDVLTGTADSDTIHGLGGNDIIAGGEGDDYLYGDDGDDVLTGNGGFDYYVGGNGFDRFSGTAAELDRDTISDIDIGDKIVITDRSLDSFSFIVFDRIHLAYSGGQLAFGSQRAGQFVASSIAGGGVELLYIADAPHNDFNGDGHSDLLWRNQSGVLLKWASSSNGLFASDPAGFSTIVSTEWRVAGTGDFDGDGRADILWRQDVTGHLVNWLATADGGFLINSTNFDSSIPSDVQIVAVGDFNRDGRDDILFRRADGLLFDWLATEVGGFRPNTENFATVVSTEWRVLGTGDFNGDRIDDILWRQDVTGHVVNWLGNPDGGFNTNALNFDTTVAADLHFDGIGDFGGGGDQIDDVLWRDGQGVLYQWQGTASGDLQLNPYATTTISPNWRVISIGDFDGDLRDDILLRENDTGELIDWLSGYRPSLSDGGLPFTGFVDNSAHFHSSVPPTVTLQDPFL